MPRECYDAVGGHAAVRRQLNEDIQLARLVKESGRRLRVVENEGLYHTRMYPTLAHAWRGWSRIFHGALATPRRLLPAITFVVLFAVVPWLSLAGGVVLLSGESAMIDRLWIWATAVWLAAVLAEHLCLWRLYSLLRQRPAWSLTYPAGACIATGMLISALLKTLGATSTTWRNTTYRRGGAAGAAADGPDQVAAPVQTEPIGRP
jgi:hypothetical protein